MSLATRVGLVLALLGPPALAFAERQAWGPVPPLAVAVGLQGVLCGIGALVLWVAWRWEQTSLGWLTARGPIAHSALLAGILVVVTQYGLPLLSAPLLRAMNVGGFETGLDAIARLPTWFRIAIALTSGPIEELLYRAYPVERLTAITGRRWRAGAVAVVVFGLAHVPFWGFGPALAADLPFGALMTVAYVVRRDFLANALAHTTLLMIGLLAVPSSPT